MGRRGPKPKPRAQKELEGTRRGDREAPNAAPSPPPGVPAPPEDLADTPWGTVASQTWFDLAPQLKKRGLLARDFAIDFFGLCDAWARWLYYRADIAEHGIKTVTEKGNETYRPEYAAMNNAWKEVRQMTARFGLNPADIGQVSSIDDGGATEEERFFGARSA